MSDSASGMPAAYATELDPDYANFQLPPGSTWVVPPTMASLFNDQFPSFESIDPAAYANFSGGNAGDVTYTSGGATAALAPWNINPAYTGDSPDASLLMGPAFPLSGGTEDLAAGTYTDPAPGTGSSTYYDFNLASGQATPTPASLDLTYKTLLDRQQGGLLGGLEQFALGLPLMATSALLSGPVLGAVLGAAGGGAAAAGAGAGAGGDVFDVGSLADLGSGLSDAAVPAGGDVFGVGSLADLGSGADVGGGLVGGSDAAGTSSDLLGNVMNLYSQAEPYISAGQDVMKIAQALTAPSSQPTTQTQSASLLQQPYMSRGLLR